MASLDDLDRWRKALTDRNFQGNIANAAVLMAALENGKEWLDERFRVRGLEFYSPPIRLVDELGKTKFQYHRGTRTFDVSLKKLQDDSLYDLSTVFDFFNPAGQLTLVGTLQESYGFGAVEEEAHGVRSQFKWAYKWDIPDWHTITTEQYHSNPFEYDALIWKIRYAKDKGLTAAQSILEKVRAAARPNYLVNKKAECRLLDLHRGVRRESLHALYGESGPYVEVA